MLLQPQCFDGGTAVLPLLFWSALGVQQCLNPEWSLGLVFVAVMGGHLGRCKLRGPASYTGHWVGSGVSSGKDFSMYLSSQMSDCQWV